MKVLLLGLVLKTKTGGKTIFYQLLVYTEETGESSLWRIENILPRGPPLALINCSPGIKWSLILVSAYNSDLCDGKLPYDSVAMFLDQPQCTKMVFNITHEAY